MSEIKRYYFLKLKEDFFDSQEIKILESMPNGIYYTNLLIKLYLKSLKHDGALKLNEHIAYDEKMVAALTNLSRSVVKNGLEVLTALKFIERLEDGTIYMSRIQSFIGKSTSEAERKSLYREKIEERKIMLGQVSVTKQGQVPLKCEGEDGTSSKTPLEKLPPENRIADNRKFENRALEHKETKSSTVSQSVILLKNFESRTGITGDINLAALTRAVELHGEENVKSAMEKALEKNKPTMTYINGILKNWAREGYPKESEESGNGSSGKNNGTGTGEYSGFKSKTASSFAGSPAAAKHIFP